VLPSLNAHALLIHRLRSLLLQVGSCVLFGLFVLFKLLPGWLVNLVISSYISLMGGIAFHWVLKPIANMLFPARFSEKEMHITLCPKLPYILDEPLILDTTLPELLLWGPSIALAVWYGFTKNWVANNYMGLSFCLLGIENIALGSPRNAVILLCGLFVYDIFWVFCTPVMVAVAKNLEAPIKLLFPRHPLWNIPVIQQLSEKFLGAAAAATSKTGKPMFAMLGLGDIVVPGFWVALMLRYDVQHKMETSYFRTVFVAYTVGLGTTIWMMNYFKAAQPALLYIVPAILLAVFGHAAIRGEVKKLWDWHEEPEEAAAQQEAEAKKAQ
jgi:minor histocompatibility antigen H13